MLPTSRSSPTQPQIVLGSKKIITVYDGEIGVSYDSGKLKVLNPARHLIENQTWSFDGFLSTQQQCISLASPGIYDPVDASAAELEKSKKKKKKAQAEAPEEEARDGPREGTGHIDSDHVLVCETKVLLI